MTEGSPAQEGARYTPNTALWLIFATTAAGVGTFFVLHVHRGLTVDSLVGLLALVARTALYLSMGLFIEALLLRSAGGFTTASGPRRVLLDTNAMTLVVVCVSLVVDLFVFAFAGYHLTTAVRILFSDGPAGAGKVVEATGLPASVVLGGTVGLAVALAAAVGLLRWTRRWSAKRPIEVSRRHALIAGAVSITALTLVDTIGYQIRNPFLWEREIRSVPLAFALVRPTAELASFRVKAKRPNIESQRALAAQVHREPAKNGATLPDVFIVVVESLRKDIVTPETMPRFSAFSNSAWTFEHAQTTGNVTHYSWYGLMCGGYPLFFDGIKNVPAEHGSVAFTALKNRGYKIRLFATPDLGYQNLESIVFGSSGALLDSKFHPPEPLPAERDRLVVRELTQTLRSEKQGGNVFVLALDSTHYDYAWGSGFQPKFTPFATDASIARNYEVDTRARHALFNRYKNSVAWMDGLLGEFFDALEQTGRMSSSIVVVTGDHGEAFWEHGSGTHGSDLGAEQVDVGFALKLPERTAAHFDGVFSLMDVMPTILSEAGVDSTQMLAGIAVQKRLNEAGILSPRSALTFQGWNSQAFRFSLTFGDKRTLLELDRANPLDARRMVLKDITNLAGDSLVQGDPRDVPSAYHSVIRDLPVILDNLPFLDL